ncbi:hypothetical protein DKX38_015701 [Salix brachista]|uniref:Wall-associated receptor kinase galacturonan-binding domain-containing protein n=1 Tax=Salix brachista TaxID=2182728 RepID=A0A5N5L6M0_9ROSI|nr:hypothetical protein DKX38_015701 [Salix brachista]
MNHNFFLTPFSPVVILFIATFFLLAKKASCTDPQFLACESKSCGDQKISFPFHIQNAQEKFCGYPGFNVSCNEKNKTVFSLSNKEYIIQEIDYQNHSLRLSNAAGFGKNTSCGPQIQNISLNDGRFRLSTTRTGVFLFYNCNSTLLENDSKLLNHKVDCFGENANVSTVAMLDDNPLLGSASEKCGAGVVAPVDVHRGVDLITPHTDSNVSALTDLMLGVVIPDLLMGLGDDGLLWVSSRALFHYIITALRVVPGGVGIVHVCLSVFFILFHLKLPFPAEEELDTTQIASPFNLVNSVKSTSHSPTPDHVHALHGNKNQPNNDIFTMLNAKSTLEVIAFPACLHCHRERGECQIEERRKNRDSSNLLSMNSSSDPSSKADLEGDGFYLSIPIFSYTELGQATDTFDESFGTVYCGKKMKV